MAKINVRDRNKNRPDKKPNWEYRFEVAKVAGKRKSVSKAGFHTKKAALAAGVIALSEYDNSGMVFTPSEISVADFFEYWIHTYAEANLADHTIVGYKSAINLYIKPKIGQYKLKNMTDVILRKAVSDIQTENELGKGSMRRIVVVIKSAFKYAKHIAKFIKDNPAEELKMPTSTIAPKQNRNTHYITREEFDKILAINKNSPQRYYGLMISYFTGLRLSEVYGLTWDCVDFENKTITVNKAVKTSLNTKRGEYKPVTWYLGECKTRSSYRTISMGDYLTEELKKYKDWQEHNKSVYRELYKEYALVEEETKSKRKIYKIIPKDSVSTGIELVMIKEDGSYGGTNSVCRCVVEARQKLGIEFTFHSLRHTHGTMLYENGASIKDIQNRLGHSSFKTTMDIYVGHTQKMQDDTVKIINSVFKIS